MTPLLEVRDIHKRFGKTAAVRGISFSLSQGEFLSLLGPSGCGKSTTLAIIAGFFDAEQGDILLKGRSVAALPVQARGIGLVFQDYAVFSKLTVRENLAFGLEVRRVRRAERRRRVAALAERLGLSAVLDRRGNVLNMSEMQKVALARVLITEPELLLLDEPMSNLDADVRAALRGELKRIQRELGQTVLYVTHDQVEAMSMSDRIAVMRDGIILQIASPDEIYRAPAHRFIAEFIGDPPINMLTAEFERDGGAVRARLPGDLNLTIAAHGVATGRYLLGIRPHQFELRTAPMPDTAAATVRYVENLGAEHVLHAELGGELIRVLAPPHAAEVGAMVNLKLDLSALLVFDAESGRRLQIERREVPV